MLSWINLTIENLLPWMPIPELFCPLRWPWPASWGPQAPPSCSHTLSRRCSSQESTPVEGIGKKHPAFTIFQDVFCSTSLPLLQYSIDFIKLLSTFLSSAINSLVALKAATISLDLGLTQGWLTIIFSGVPSSGNALAIPSPFCPPEPQPLPPTSPAAFSPSQSPPPPPITTTRLVQSGFLMHSELSKNKPAKPSRRARSAAAKRYFVLYHYSGVRNLVNREEPWIDWSWVRF